MVLHSKWKRKKEETACRFAFHHWLWISWLHRDKQSRFEFIHVHWLSDTWRQVDKHKLMDYFRLSALFSHHRSCDTPQARIFISILARSLSNDHDKAGSNYVGIVSWSVIDKRKRAVGSAWNESPRLHWMICRKTQSEQTKTNDSSRRFVLYVFSQLRQLAAQLPTLMLFTRKSIDNNQNRKWGVKQQEVYANTTQQHGELLVEI